MSDGQDPYDWFNVFMMGMRFYRFNYEDYLWLKNFNQEIGGEG